MAKYIKKCSDCREEFSQEVNPKDFSPYGLCDKCSEKIKKSMKVIDVSCFSMNGDYVCPYYGKQYTDEAKEHCAKCWNL